jgi:hypothetical protein
MQVKFGLINQRRNLMSAAAILALIEQILGLVPSVVAALEGAHAAISAKSAPVVAPVSDNPSAAPLA